VNATRSTAPYGVLKAGPKTWYVQAVEADPSCELAAGNIVGISFSTKSAAVLAATSRNEVRGYRGPIPVETAAWA
jgi:hypothetical protein